MPVLKMMNKPYNDDMALQNVVEYVLRPGYGYIGAYAVDEMDAVVSMNYIKDIWYKNKGRRIRHFILSFGRSEHIAFYDALDLAPRICQYYSEYQSVFGIHTDTDNLHIHFAVNTVSFDNGKMYSGNYSDWVGLQKYVQALLPKHYVSLVMSDGSDYQRKADYYDTICG